jgi:putative transposase
MVGVQAMRKLSVTYPRFGGRRIRILLKRQEVVLSKERCARIWSLAGLQVPKKQRRKTTTKKERIPKSNSKNSVWSYDFVHDSCANA